MRRVLKYERVKRRDVESIMVLTHICSSLPIIIHRHHYLIYAHPQGMTCATEVQVVHALLATDCVVQDAVHLLLNTT